MQVFSINSSDLETMSKEQIGGKAHGLVSMRKLGLPVPFALIIPTKESIKYLEGAVTEEEVSTAVGFIKAQLGLPRLVSVRSGAPVSMPGMMDTILNVGLCSTTFDYWVEQLGYECAHNSYCKLIQMFANVVYGVSKDEFPKESNSLQYLAIYEKLVGTPFPERDEQLSLAITAVFKSWNTPRAIEYRKIHGYPHNMGTAVVVQEMVFGNLNDESCTGVLFTRNPSTGEAKVVGEYLVNAQGEDVVAGIKTPEPLSTMGQWNAKVYGELLAIATLLENYNNDMQDIEFTVHNGKLYILQTRSAKRTALAAIKVVTDFYKEGRLKKVQDLKDYVTFNQYVQAIRPVVAPDFKEEPTGYGLPASNGIVTGVAVFSSEEAVACPEPCILITEETTPDDIKGMNAALGILTKTGGATSHAAVVARGLDKVCVVGCEGLEISGKIAKLNGATIGSACKVTIDGNSGAIWFNTEVPVVNGEGSETLIAFKALINTFYPKAAMIHTVIEKAFDATTAFYVEAETEEAIYKVLGTETQIHSLASLCHEVDTVALTKWAEEVCYSKNPTLKPTIVVGTNYFKGVVPNLVKEVGENISYTTLDTDIETLCTNKHIVLEPTGGTSLENILPIKALRKKANDPMIIIGLATEGDVELYSFEQLLSKAIAC